MKNPLNIAPEIWSKFLPVSFIPTNPKWYLLKLDAKLFNINIDLLNSFFRSYCYFIANIDIFPKKEYRVLGNMPHNIKDDIIDFSEYKNESTTPPTNCTINTIKIKDYLRNSELIQKGILKSHSITIAYEENTNHIKSFWFCLNEGCNSFYKNWHLNYNSIYKKLLIN